ncbi:helix-turn-helix domain-containing protein [Haladaptatus sp. DFWS20]|uniref:helix-turn-helix domain-containing protein n=1 Tax=Haladaptatus sp. DFWS20 TaxID=3403467 RepID=UPI003EBB32A1
MSGESNNATNQPHPSSLTKPAPTVGDGNGSNIEQQNETIERQLYDIVAEVSLSGSDLLLSPTIKAASDVTIRTEHLTETTPVHLFISVCGEQFGAFEQALQRDYTVADPVLVETYDGRRVYRLEPVSSVNLIAPRCPELDARILNVESGDDGWIVRMQIPTREALVSFREYCLENDVTFRVNQLGSATDHEETDVVGLTEKQKQLLRMAFECGYYEIPRRISQNELARELDISTSAISQRLRRDTEQLIGSTLAVEKNR